MEFAVIILVHGVDDDRLDGRAVFVGPVDGPAGGVGRVEGVHDVGGQGVVAEVDDLGEEEQVGLVLFKIRIFLKKRLDRLN